MVKVVRQGGKIIWTTQLDQLLTSLRKNGMTTRDIAKRIGVSQGAVQGRFTALLGVKRRRKRADPSTPTEEQPSLLEQQSRHLQNIRAKQRGFTIPAELERDYIDLLKQGLPIAEALKRLGVSRSKANTGE